MNSSILLVFFSIISTTSLAMRVDSTLQTPSAWTLTPRFNTLNMAPVSGNIVNNHVNIDVTLAYSKRQFTWTTQNGIDLQDGGSEMNYFLSNIRYRINLGRRFSCTPFLAFYSEHAHQWVDPVSDFNAGLFISYRQNSLMIEAFFLLVRLTHADQNKDVINRFEIKYTFHDFIFSGFVFVNNGHFDNKERIAIGFRGIFPEIKLFNALNVRSEITGSFGVYENPPTTNLSGVFLSLAFPFRFM